MAAPPKKKCKIQVLTESPLPEFDVFRQVMQEYQDKRERLIRVSREITIQSKRMIFALHQAASKKFPLEQKPECCEPYKNSIQKQMQELAAELDGFSSDQYCEAYSPGFQEYVEAVTFEHWLADGTVLPYERLETAVVLPPSDYVLGLCDLTGEIMRFCVTNGNKLKKEQLLKSLLFLQALEMSCTQILGHTTRRQRKSLTQKLEVMRSSIQKVENICYGRTMRRHTAEENEVKA
ncbi:hypothetical protein SJAG_04091 [Schizosaccharomyces japonicus yFS275]|uniref:Translin n=1 Tax=Schizosaccharomyces japonicus (strain yFS275 / FY16936) TaxID=402676 RepID=B6K5W6_SCHJY|nr:hypothetical protein SJAG_04091 [Schizosaccharomyces japonicus yFS275]EEB08920.1 hypothetical protein SJAG_04091 [Schizosaccharomyces japonicus yFS275]